MDLENVKPGDKLAIRRHGSVIILTAARTTATRAVCEGGRVFSRKNGREIGVGSYPAHAFIASDKDIALARTQQLRDQIGYRLSRIEKLPLDKLEAIYALLTEKPEGE